MVSIFRMSRKKQDSTNVHAFFPAAAATDTTVNMANMSEKSMMV